MREEIKRIPGFSEYGVTKEGEVYSFKKAKPYKLKLFPQVWNYEMCNLHSDKGKKLTVLVHQLVMQVFGPPRPFPPRDYRINHKDGNKRNNHIDNLRWIHKKDVNTKRRIPIKAEGIDDGDIIYFRSVTDAARYFHTHNQMLRSKIDANVPYKGYVFSEFKKD